MLNLRCRRPRWFILPIVGLQTVECDIILLYWWKCALYGLKRAESSESFLMLHSFSWAVVSESSPFKPEELKSALHCSSSMSEPLGASFSGWNQRNPIKKHSLLLCTAFMCVFSLSAASTVWSGRSPLCAHWRKCPVCSLGRQIRANIPEWKRPLPRAGCWKVHIYVRRTYRLAVSSPQHLYVQSLLIKSEGLFLCCRSQLNGLRREFEDNPVIRLSRQMADPVFPAVPSPAANSPNGTLMMGICVRLMVYSRGAGSTSVLAPRQPPGETHQSVPGGAFGPSHIPPLTRRKSAAERRELRGWR